jgi:hypothetical protein
MLEMLACPSSSLSMSTPPQVTQDTLRSDRSLSGQSLSASNLEINDHPEPPAEQSQSGLMGPRLGARETSKQTTPRRTRVSRKPRKPRKRTARLLAKLQRESSCDQQLQPAWNSALIQQPQCWIIRRMRSPENKLGHHLTKSSASLRHPRSLGIATPRHVQLGPNAAMIIAPYFRPAAAGDRVGEWLAILLS